jgi:type II secretory pathway component PulF
MPNFIYQALNEQRELIVGKVQADGVQQAIAQLEANGLAVQSIRIETLKTWAPEPSLSADYDASAAEAVLQRQLATLLQRGRTLTPALRAYLEELPAGDERRELSAVCNAIDSGDAAAASQAMTALPEYWIPLLCAAAASGDAGRVIRDFLRDSHEAAEFRGQRWRNVAYPTIVALVALAVAVMLSWVVLPVFREVFYEFGICVPVLTAWLIAAGNWMVSWQGAATVAIAVLIAILAAAGSLPGLKHLRASRWGSWFGRSTAIAQFTRFTAELLGAGVNRGDAVRIAAHTTRHPAMQGAGWDLAAALEADAPDPPPKLRPVPTTAAYALQADLPSAARQRLLLEISGCYADWTSRRRWWSRGLIGPAAILVVGIAVGFVVLALFIPLVTLVNSLVG